MSHAYREYLTDLGVSHSLWWVKEEGVIPVCQPRYEPGVYMCVYVSIDLCICIYNHVCVYNKCVHVYICIY